MKKKLLSRTLSVLATALLVAAVALLSACGGGSKRSSDQASATESPSMSPHIAAFEANPNVATWEPLHEDILEGPLTSADESRIVEVFSTKTISQRIVNAAAVDLALIDWAGTMKWVHQLNVASRTDLSPQGRQMVRNTARFAWLMLTLRASYVTDFVDLSHADLRVQAPFIGQAMNLANVDFSGSELSGGTWRGANLGSAIFNDATVHGVLRCENCTFGSMQYSGTATLTDGKWMAR
jgi:hypothetical protein